MIGPPIEVLLRRLVETPAEFRAEPSFHTETSATSAPTVDVAAVVSDALVVVGHKRLGTDEASFFRPKDSPSAENWLRCVLVGSWLITHFDVMTDRALDAQRLDIVQLFLKERLAELSELVDADQLVSDPERREEVARLLLHDLALLPAGETQVQAADRLATLDSVNRKRVMDQARIAEQRAAKVRQALESQRAAEAAAKASRE